jgi:macrolide-specific efflux system membrane fusion protein
MSFDVTTPRDPPQKAPPGRGKGGLHEFVVRSQSAAKRVGLRTWLVLIASVTIGAIGYFWVSRSNVAALETISAPVARENIEMTVLATGTLEPARLVSVGAQVSGQVKKLHVELGDIVGAGDPIADIDSRTQTNSVSNAQAGLTNAHAQRASRQANLIKAQRTYDRLKRLYAEGATSKSEFEAAEAALANARADVNAIDAQIRQSSLTLNTAETNLGYTKILAPMDGTVVAIVTEEGQTVNANQSAPTIIKLAQLDKMTVSAEVSEADVEKVTPGQTVYFTTLGNPNERRYAELRAIAPAPESIEKEVQASSSTASAVYYNALFDVDNTDGKLKTGMTAQVYVVLASAKDALSIPSSALEGPGRDGLYRVSVVGKDGKTEQRQVKIGINTNVVAEVLEGLKEGEEVIVARAAGSTGATTTTRRARNPIMMGGPPGGGSP